jgi:hypothetical protein
MERELKRILEEEIAEEIMAKMPPWFRMLRDGHREKMLKDRT